MRLGILSDIHEDTAALRAALATFAREGVDRVVLLGDLFRDGAHAAATVDLLATAGATGVWGNHDLGMCLDPDPDLVDRHPPRVFAFSRTLRPRLEVADCLFAHGPAQWDAADPLSYLGDERPEEAPIREACFAASPARVTFMGHFHRWLCASQGGILPWQGEEPIVLDPAERFMVVVGAVCDGWCAVYDSASARLEPHSLGATGPGR